MAFGKIGRRNMPILRSLGFHIAKNRGFLDIKQGTQQPIGQTFILVLIRVEVMEKANKFSFQTNKNNHDFETDKKIEEKKVALEDL